MTSPSDAPVLIVGGRGFVGSAAVRGLLAEGRPVAVFGPASPVPLPDGAREIVGSIERPDEIAAALAATGARQVVSFAAFSAGAVGLARSGDGDPEGAFAVNVLGFRRLLEACAEAGVRRVVWTSSTVVFGAAEDPESRVAEDAPRRPVQVYGLTKVLAEDVARWFGRVRGLETVALRIPLMIGPGLWYDGAAAVLKRMIAAAARGEDFAAEVPAGRFDAMHVDDLARLIGRTLDAPKGLADTYNLAGYTTSYGEIAATLAAIVPGWQAPLTEVPPAVFYPLQDQRRIEADIGLDLAHDLRSTLADMLNERTPTP
ncbi:UDP-glucose 4-epimerase [Stella humosa]|uniref:UDP-glucose 4-epimerase n=1 Tax=Stella humosa TaxID=94 RepID=A0A3N1MHC0_9PROT|nr:NAD(P)-dependent oxidoreductase [Stella humosa]ROQ02030.1 UDP-glucose 4-epimerase [Stella humosa]BBK32420.1 nucleoside-diphosphate sugar epimerase [Stella humosa]